MLVINIKYSVSTRGHMQQHGLGACIRETGIMNCTDDFSASFLLSFFLCHFTEKLTSSRDSVEMLEKKVILKQTLKV